MTRAIYSSLNLLETDMTFTSNIDTSHPMFKLRTLTTILTTKVFGHIVSDWEHSLRLILQPIHPMTGVTNSRHRYGDKVLKILDSKKQLQCFD